MNKKVKKLGYGVGIHYNQYVDIFEVYRLGTYYPSDPNFIEYPNVVKNKSLKKAIKKYRKIFLVK
jgi:hypothetical protein